ncbi:MAG: hypothetical protein K2N94_14805 [Lachnospiraceae bacterium]|nr:hypothetical protein [Lachnospiraceae bacterium]
MRGKYLDLAVALLLLFFIPGTVIHVKAREREFDICAARAEEYVELIQRQGYCTAEVMRELSGVGKGILGEAELVLQISSGQSGWRYVVPAEEDCVIYMEERVYPFHTGDMLRLQIRMPYDGLERFYFGLCFPGADSRQSVKSGVIRDGLLERLDGPGPVGREKEDYLIVDLRACCR